MTGNASDNGAAMLERCALIAMAAGSSTHSNRSECLSRRWI